MEEMCLESCFEPNHILEEYVTGKWRQTNEQLVQIYNQLLFTCYIHTFTDREFVTSAKKFENFNEFSGIKKIRKYSYSEWVSEWVVS